QQENAELCDAIEHGFLLGRVRKDGVLQGGPEHAQHRGAKHDAAEQHSHDRRLADAVHDLTQEAPDQHQRDELYEEDDVRRPGLDACGGESRCRAQPQRDDGDRPARKHARAKLRRTVEQVMDLWNSRALNPAGQRMFPLAPSSSACGDFSEPPADAAHRWPCNCKLFATRLWRWRRIVSMAVSSVPERRSSSAPAHSETGWRHSRSTPSLSEVFGSVATRPKGPLW